MTAPIAVPSAIEGVTAEWLTAALGQNYPGIAVRKAEVLANMGGACTKLRVRLETSDPAFPETVVVKGCFEPHTRGMAGMQYLEAMTYARIVPELDGVETIRCHFAQGDTDLGSALIMEDLALRQATCLNALEPIASYALAEEFLGNLARLHAKWWESDALLDKSRFGFIGHGCELVIAQTESVLGDPALLAAERQKPRAACLSRRMFDGPRLLAAFARLKELSRALPHTLTHGDTHPSNLFTTADGKGGLLDWTAMRAPWAQDVSYFIGGNLDPYDRRDWERPLLQSYLSALKAEGVQPPPFEEAWLQYRAWMIWGIYVWLPNFTDYHSEDKITAMTSRFGAAMVDLDVLGVIERGLAD